MPPNSKRLTTLRVIDAVSDGKVLRYVDENETVVLEKDGYEEVLALTEFGKRKSWLLSGWKANVPDAVSEVGTQSEATQSKPTFSRQELGADLNNIAQNAGKSSWQSVYPEEALRTRRLVDMMMPVVGSFIDQDGEYYAAKLKVAYKVDISPKEALAIAHEAIRVRRQASIKRSWQQAIEYFRSANPVFDFFLEFSDKQIINPGKGFEGEDFTGTFISEAYRKYSVKEPQEKRSDKQYKKYLEKREKGAKKIISVHYAGLRNPVTANEVIQIGDVIRRGILVEDGTAEHPTLRRYELKAEDGATLKVIIDFYRKNDKNRSMINFYSDRKTETGAHNVSSGNITDPNTNIALNDEKSSRQSVNPEEALRTKRLVDMMMPVVGSFIDQDGEYYAAKLKVAYKVDISPEEALAIAHEAIRARRQAF